MKIVIFGLAKSGTTALFYKLKNSLPSDTICLFEPRSFAPKTGLLASLRRRRSQPHVLAKVLPFRPSDPADVESFASFERQVLIVRDPRDRLISRLLYGIYDAEVVRHEDRIKTVIKTLEQKETNPRSIAVKTLIELFANANKEQFSFADWATTYTQHSVSRPLEFHRAHDNVFLFKYEDMVEGGFRELEEYLALALNGDARVAPELSRVTRTRSYGGWRDWFTEEDVDWLRPIMQPFLDRYYADADWELSRSPSIPSEHGSRYVLRIVNERRALLKLAPVAN